MQFLHDRQSSANSRPHERLDEKEWWCKDRDIKRHGKISSYFTAAQRALGEEDPSHGSPSTLNTRKRTPPSKDRGGREIYKTPSEVPLTRPTSESASWPPLGHVSGLKDASASRNQRLSTAVRSDRG